MLKKFAFVLLLALPLSMFAQELKFGHIDRAELLQVMPEAIEAQRRLEDLVLKYRTETAKLESEFQTKLNEFQQNSATLDPAIRALRESELNRMFENIQNFTSLAQEELQRTQMEAMIPIERKINNALETIGREEGFMYIFDVQAQAILYFSPKSVNVLPKVKRKLNLR